MIKLSDKVYVSASAIQSICRSDYGDHIIVKTFDGDVYSVDPDFGQAGYEKLNELVQAVRQDSGVSK